MTTSQLRCLLEPLLEAVTFAERAGIYITDLEDEIYIRSVGTPMDRLRLVVNLIEAFKIDTADILAFQQIKANDLARNEATPDNVNSD